ncbi:hypothetical protein M9194_11720 [Vibrio sp. S4M6]|uniref:hypothetical protein n=1 Tax=Vibrio sinus TaxID=2946865 RepID=UPI00202AA1CE|nr:hypothetical protein [Vibrio sinus]MCL9782095.1 hypothetical protein [Vibrio sinus]
METIDSPESIAAQDHWSALFKSAATMHEDEKKQAVEAEEQKQEEETPKENEVSPATAAMIETSLGAVFGVTEIATSVISGVKFQLDEEGKQKVSEAAVPVIAKYGGQWLAACGSYAGELVLLCALGHLIYSSRLHLSELKEEKRQREKEKNAKKESASIAA